MSVETARLTLTEIESRVCDIASEQLGIARSEVHPGLRLIQDLHCDSLCMLEFFMNVEGAFNVDLPADSQDTVYKSVFTRDPLRLKDFAELVYLQLGSGRPRRARRARRRWMAQDPAPQAISNGNPFTQLSGRAWPKGDESDLLFESLGKNSSGFPTYRRRTDGMICVRIPAADAWIGAESDDGSVDERPAHRVWLDEFLIDQEPVSTTAYCRFLNSIGFIEPAVLEEWFVLAANDKRREHMLIRQDSTGWTPLTGVERMPMMLVSWYGANAYSLWANRHDWRGYRSDQSATDSTFLPSEAQWEYSARGSLPRQFPWGDEAPTQDRMRYAQHAPGRTYRPETLPISEVNEDLGVSPFGVRHMAGNIWQWCADWYAPDFYTTPQACAANPVNRHPTRIRSERGGSWIGPAFLCRSAYRRGRVPIAKGRCLGFRCVSETETLTAYSRASQVLQLRRGWWDVR